MAEKMGRTELTLIVAGAFLGAVLLGWLLNWGFTRIRHASQTSADVTNDMASRLHAAEEARDAAFGERDEAVSDMKNRLRETEAELAAAMDGLGNARREADNLRAELADLRG